MKPNERLIAKAKSILKDAGYIVNLFHKDDITSMPDGETLTDSELNSVIELLEKMDATIGVNWESIGASLDHVIENRKNIPVKYEVQTQTICDGWTNIWHIHHEDGTVEPETFGSLTDAWLAVFEFIEEIDEEITLGHREPDEGYYLTDFRVEPVNISFQH